MLFAETPFPQQGSWALLDDFDEAGKPKTFAVRILRDNCDGTFSISIPARFGASGNMTIEAARLIDATPLTEAERAEYNRLGRTIPAALARKGSRVRIQQDRYTALRLRDIHSATLRSLRAALPKLAA